MEDEVVGPKRAIQFMLSAILIVAILVLLCNGYYHIGYNDALKLGLK